MLRTSVKMSDNDELMISLNSHWFDIDFEDAYKDLPDNKDTFLKYWRPCYKINPELVPNLSNMLGRPMEMFG